MQTTKLSKPRQLAVFSGTEKTGVADLPECEFAEGLLRDAREDLNSEMTVSDVKLRGVSFRSAVALSPGQVHFLAARGAGTTLSSAVRIVSCRLRSDGRFDLTAEFF